MTADGNIRLNASGRHFQTKGSGAYRVEVEVTPSKQDGKPAVNASQFFPRQIVIEKGTGRKGHVTRITPEGIFVNFGWKDDAAAILMKPDMLSRAPVKSSTRQLSPRASDLLDQMVPLHSIKPNLTSRYLVKGWIDRGAFSVVYSESNVGKTFFALDLSLHVAAAVDWHGNRVPGNEDYAGPVFYVAGEGGLGIDNRIEAIRRERPDLMQYAEENGDFVLMKTMLDMTGSNDARDLVDAIMIDSTEPALIVIDTLAMAFGGGDENATRDMGVFIANCAYIRAETGAHVMVIHHSGKDTSRGARGSGALRAASDTEIELTRQDKVIVATQRKQRDMPTDKTFAYTLRSVLLGDDEDGEKVFSAVVEPTEAPAKPAPRLKGQALIAMQAFADAIKDHGVVKGGEDFPTNRQCVSLDHWREACDRHALSSGEADSSKRAAFHKAWKALQEREVIRVLDGYAWRVAE